MQIQNINSNNNMLLELLLSLPFPFKEELRAQIASSSIHTVCQPDYYCMEFQVSPGVPPLPGWLITAPLSFQIPRSGAPYQCILYRDSNGYIDCFEVISMDFSEIQWEDFGESSPLPDYEFDIDYLKSILQMADVSIGLVSVSESALMLCVEKNHLKHTMLFLNCEYRSIPIEKEVITSEILVSQQNDANNIPRYTLCSTDRKIDIDYSLMLEHKNVII